MRSRRHGRTKEAPELDITAFLNLMVVLVPFLLVSAVFSRVTILELNMPAGAGGGAEDPGVTLEVVVRKEVLEISDGDKVIARFPNLNREEGAEAGAAVAAEGAAEEDVPLDENGLPVILPTEEVYDLAKLREHLIRIKEAYPDKTDSVLLMEQDVAYEHLVGVMDAVRSAQVMPKVEEGMQPDPEATPETLELFPDISLGDAP
ncbi:ExbD/TolR family protein [Microbulbifer hydrolyticus]|uniref:Biopolymer transport protein ExbD n=1 Tax=Microbulbifer hydrolyticus TaxID=48074 RepID=A0A6P1TEC9_9GAMM|nr:biopolymer transporter ExbD [Microbulbifer hydrolyticus]MBB5212375.1 biopolymer transport protein ExbD [Microbulbifer hydrolyticus]QHQ40015.1 biopolymer transporter ExbD [Microbulbifer hydrolyticus]